MGIREVFLKIAVRVIEEESLASYGVISVISAPETAEIRLDGGVVGQASADGEITLRNVPVGLHQVRTDDSSGREVSKVVRVRPDRTVLVELGRPGSSRSPARHELIPLGKNAQGYEEFRRGSDGAVVAKIPTGEFLMGNKETERSPLEHRVYVSEFLMDKTGVTWGQYKRFAAATGL